MFIQFWLLKYPKYTIPTYHRCLRLRFGRSPARQRGSGVVVARYRQHGSSKGPLVHFFWGHWRTEPREKKTWNLQGIGQHEPRWIWWFVFYGLSWWFCLKKRPWNCDSSSNVFSPRKTPLCFPEGLSNWHPISQNFLQVWQVSIRPGRGSRFQWTLAIDRQCGCGLMLLKRALAHRRGRDGRDNNFEAFKSTFSWNTTAVSALVELLGLDTLQAGRFNPSIATDTG